MSTGGFRLKVELNRIVKFYIKIAETNTFSELKKTISKILKESYNIRLISYSLRSEDGFELLDTFKVGDLLIKDQIIVVDAFTGSAFQQQSIPIQGNISYKKASTVKLPILHAKEASKNRVEIAKGSPVTIKTVTEDITKKASEVTQAPTKANNIQPPVETKSDNLIKSVKTKEVPVPKTINASTIEKLQHPERTILLNVNSSKDAPIQPKPENFKGFAVKKADLLKEQQINTDEISFKPLKKRKIEENQFEDAF
ncbi:hypothetical protein GINT2_000928 [Glugoides intestinalis]